MVRKVKDIIGVEKHYLHEMLGMDIEFLKEHYFAVNEAIVYHEQKASDANSYKYRIDQIMKVRNWLRVEEEALNG